MKLHSIKTFSLFMTRSPNIPNNGEVIVPKAMIRPHRNGHGLPSGDIFVT